MKKKIVYPILLMILCTCCICPVYADDSELNLDTDSLKNKEDDYSSLTDINGLNLFTNEVQEIIKKEVNEQEKGNLKKKEILFTNQIKESKEKNITLFSNPITFDKTLQSDESQIPVNLILLVITIVMGGSVFMVTRQYYKHKEEQDNEVNFDFYK